jgi:hypothetical protein
MASLRWAGVAPGKPLAGHRFPAGKSNDGSNA